MSIYVILDIDVHDEEKYLEYQEQVPAIIKKHGGRYSVRGGDIIALGEWKPDRIVVIEFPSLEKLQTFISCPEYAPHQELLLLRVVKKTSLQYELTQCITWGHEPPIFHFECEPTRWGFYVRHSGNVPPVYQYYPWIPALLW